MQIKLVVVVVVVVGNKRCGNKIRCRLVFSQLFRGLSNLYNCYHNFMETKDTFLYFFYKINAQRIFCFHRVMVNGFQPISA